MVFPGQRESRTQVPMAAIRRFSWRKRPFIRPILRIVVVEKMGMKSGVTVGQVVEVRARVKERNGETVLEPHGTEPVRVLDREVPVSPVAPHRGERIDDQQL